MGISSTFVPPWGDPDSDIVIVGEQPGKMEVKHRQPFIGPAGRELTDDMHVIGLARQEAYLTNVIKDLDRPLDFYFKYNKGKAIVSQPWYDYLGILEKELSKTRGLIVTVGNVALYALTGNLGITKWRGSVLESILLPGRTVLPIIHPATVIPPKNQFLNRILIQFDLARAKQIIEGKFQQSKYEIIIRPTYQACLDFLETCYQMGLKGYSIDYDIETRNMQVSCISFCYNTIQAISIPFVHETGDYFTIPQEVEIWRAIAKILQDPRIRKRGQNLSFDVQFLLRQNHVIGHNFDDTMIAQKTIMPEFPMGLDFITSIHTTHPYYKDEGKKFFDGSNFPRLWRYNGTDSCICSEAFPKQYQDLMRQGNLETYERQRRLIEPLVYMMERGIKADMPAIYKKAEELDKEIEDLTRQLHAMVGYELNPNSPQQLQRFFYGIQGNKSYKKRGTNKVTTDNDALKRLVRKGNKEAAMLQKIRKVSKIRSTYIEPRKFDEDGRIRCSYNPVGTRFSRLSSSESIYGTGMNMQNWPHDCLQYLLADEGYMYFDLDLAQAENRLVAYIGKIDSMIEAFETGKDLHRLTAGLILNKDPNDVSDEDGSCPLGSGEHSERFWGKKANHGLNYDLGFRSFALYYELLERDAKMIVDKYHQVYPGVRSGFHAFVKKCLRESRTLINLMGRRTLFLGPLNDDTFKEAYSCIPQGTVGDIINEKGLEYIYYNQQEFGPIELLKQVHDSIGFQIPVSVGWENMARMVYKIKNNLEVPLHIHDYDFIVPVDVTIGLNMHKESGIELKHKKFPQDISALSERLRLGYEELMDKRGGKR